MTVPEACPDVAYSLLRAVKERKYTTLLAHLDHLNLPEGKNLFVQFPSHHGCGDRSRLYVADSMYRQEWIEKRENTLAYYWCPINQFIGERISGNSIKKRGEHMCPPLLHACPL
jgi:hypothetical protein